MKKTIWALMDDRAGSVGQAKGIFPVIEDEFEIIEKKIVYNRLAALPNMLRGKTLIGVNRKESSPLKNEPFPDAVLPIRRRAGPRGAARADCAVAEKGLQRQNQDYPADVPGQIRLKRH